MSVNIPHISVRLAVLLTLVGAMGHSNVAQQAVVPGEALFRDCDNCPEMVRIPAGSFVMGASDDETERDVKAVLPVNQTEYARRQMRREHPAHTVSISRAFAMSKYRVTRDEFAMFIAETRYPIDRGCRDVNQTYRLQRDASWQNPGFTQIGRDPVICVNWFDARAYISWLNEKIRRSNPAVSRDVYRMATEAEWEYAARAGTRAARWWGDEIGTNEASCDGCGSAWDDLQPATVGSFRSNPFGLSDVLGSAWEWTEDCWNETYANAPGDGRAWLSGDCRRRVFRGGNWRSVPWVLRSSYRSATNQDGRTNDLSFRVVKDLLDE